MVPHALVTIEHAARFTRFEKYRVPSFPHIAISYLSPTLLISASVVVIAIEMGQVI